jgi:hypothetical protein
MQRELPTIDFSTQAEVRLEAEHRSHRGSLWLVEELVRRMADEISPVGAAGFAGRSAFASARGRWKIGWRGLTAPDANRQASRT